MTAPNRPPLPCGCPCGCSRSTPYPEVGSAFLARRVRCPVCLEPEHRARYQQTPLDAGRTTTTPKPITGDEAAWDARILAEQKARIRAKELAAWQARLPAKFQNATTEHPSVMAALARWAEGRPGTAGLGILGATGYGKTWAAIGYANAAIKIGLVQPSQILYGTEAELLANAANAKYGDVAANLRQLTDRRYRMLIIDDVGRGPWLRDDMRQKVFAVVADAAWRDNKVLVVTTNLTNDSLKEYVGEAAWDRIGSAAGYQSTVFLAGREEHMRKTITLAAAKPRD